MTRPTDFNVQTLIDDLQGSCATIEERLPDGMEWNDLTKEDHAAIDEDIFCCEDCGWWCTTDEANENPNCGGDICNDCAEN